MNKHDRTYYDTRTTFHPIPGELYQNEGGGLYRCIGHTSDGGHVFRNAASRWQCTCYGVGQYADGAIDWDYSLHGCFV